MPGGVAEFNKEYLKMGRNTSMRHLYSTEYWTHLPCLASTGINIQGHSEISTENQKGFIAIYLHTVPMSMFVSLSANKHTCLHIYMIDRRSKDMLSMILVSSAVGTYSIDVIWLTYRFYLFTSIIQIRRH